MTTLANLLTAGDTLDFTTSVPDYPASAGWTLKYRMVPRTGSNPAIALTAAADGDDYNVTATSTTTATWALDNYTWSAYVELGAERYTVDRGQLQIRAGSSTMVVGTDGRTHARKVLDAIEALIESKGSADVVEYTIGNRSIKKMPMADLLTWRNNYAYQVQSEERAERLANGLNAGGKIQVRF
jgi:enamine deaminase RidA (YjgF/YER057c/UK114 family)